MTKLTKEDIGYLFEAALLNFEGVPLTKIMSDIKPQHIIVGKKVLDFMREEWEK